MRYNTSRSKNCKWSQLNLSCCFPRLEYYITDGDKSLFSVTKTPNAGPKLSTLVALDYETSKQHSVVVIAKDVANECHKSRAVIQIDVLDANDNSPEFGSDEYTASIAENAQKGTLVKKV